MDGWMVKFSKSEQKEAVFFVIKVSKTFFLFVALTAVVGCCDVGVADTTRLAFLLHSPAKDFFTMLEKTAPMMFACVCKPSITARLAHYLCSRAWLVYGQ